MPDKTKITYVNSAEGVAAFVNKLPRGSTHVRGDYRKTYIALRDALAPGTPHMSTAPPIAILVPAHPKDSKPSPAILQIESNSVDSSAFTLKSKKWHGMTAKMFLEDSNFPKVCFNAGPLLKALLTHYNVAMRGVEDIQLMELHMRTPGHLKNCRARQLESQKQPASLYYCVNMIMDENGIKDYQLPQVQYLQDLHERYSLGLTQDTKNKIAREPEAMLQALLEAQNSSEGSDLLLDTRKYSQSP